MVMVLIGIMGLVASQVNAATLQGVIISVYDGDGTMTLQMKRGQEKLRLGRVDCPELAQRYGKQARQYTVDHVLGKRVTAYTTERDHYGRRIAEVTLADGSSLNQWLVYSGSCWHYAEYSDDPILPLLEQDARQARRGLWSEENPIKPSLWRKQHRGKDD